MLADDLELRWSFIWLSIISLCFLWSAGLYAGHEIGYAVPVVMLAGACGSFLVWYAACRKQWAILTVYAVMLFWCAASFRVREKGNVSVDWQNGTKVIFWCVLWAVSLLNYRRIIGLLSDPVVLCFAAYTVLAGLSTIYSPAPAVTATVSFAISAYLMFACFLVCTIPERTLILTATWTLFVFCVVSLLVGIALPEVGVADVLDPGDPGADPWRLQGIAGHPNQLGMVAVFGAMCASTALYRGYLRCRWWLPMMILIIGVILLTKSRTSFITLLIAGVLQLPKRYLIPILTISSVLVGSIFVFGLVGVVLQNVGRGGNIEDATTLAGRTELWAFAWGLIKERPLLGWGYASFEAFASVVWTGDAWAPIVSIHNNYLDMLYGTGVLGSLPLITAFGLLLYRWRTGPDLPRDMFTVQVLIYGYSEADFPSLAIVPTLTYFLIIALDAHRRVMLGGLRLYDPAG